LSVPNNGLCQIGLARRARTLTMFALISRLSRPARHRARLGLGTNASWQQTVVGSLHPFGQALPDCLPRLAATAAYPVWAILTVCAKLGTCAQLAASTILAHLQSGGSQSLGFFVTCAHTHAALPTWPENFPPQLVATQSPHLTPIGRPSSHARTHTFLGTQLSTRQTDRQTEGEHLFNWNYTNREC